MVQPHFVCVCAARYYWPNNMRWKVEDHWFHSWIHSRICSINSASFSKYTCVGVIKNPLRCRGKWSRIWTKTHGILSETSLDTQNSSQRTALSIECTLPSSRSVHYGTVLQSRRQAKGLRPTCDRQLQVQSYLPHMFIITCCSKYKLLWWCEMLVIDPGVVQKIIQKIKRTHVFSGCWNFERLSDRPGEVFE